MSSLKNQEGYFLVDHSNSPGISEELARASGLAPEAATGKYEEACFTCSHCEVIVVKNRDRVRPRGYCPGCDHYICDGCTYKREVLGERCMPFKAIAYEAINKAIRESTFKDTSEVSQSLVLLP